MNQLEINSLAETGFNNFKVDSEKNPQLVTKMEKHLVKKTKMNYRKK